MTLSSSLHELNPSNPIFLQRDTDSVRDIDMLHAPDYTNMSLGKLLSTVNQRKAKDAEIKNNIRFIFHKLCPANFKLCTYDIRKKRFNFQVYH